MTCKWFWNKWGQVDCKKCLKENMKNTKGVECPQCHRPKGQGHDGDCREDGDNK